MTVIGRSDYELGKRLERWIACLIDGLDEYVDDETKARVLERCGRQCQSQHFVKKARKIYKKSEDVDEFLNEFMKVYKNLRREDYKIYVVYPKCYCSHVNKIPQEKLSATFCNCSKGWVKELFEGALNKSVDVIMEESIINGDKQCKLQIVL